MLTMIHVVLFALTTVILSTTAWAQTPVLLTESPNYFRASQLGDLTHKTLGVSCHGMVHLDQTLPCNPASLGIKPLQRFTGSLYLGDEYSTVDRYRKLLDDDRSMDLVREIFKEKPVILAEAGTDLWFRGERFSLAFTPARFSYYSAVRNRSFPKVGLFIMQESQLMGQLSHQLSEEVHLGLQGRYVHREFIYDEFALLETLAYDDFVNVKTQEAFYLEPGLIWRLEDRVWNPMVSVFLGNGGWADEHHHEVNLDPQLILATGLSHELTFGTWDFSLAYLGDSHEDKDWSRWRVGSAIGVGLMQAMASWQEDEWSAGVLSSLWNFQIGVSYINREVENIYNSRKREDAIFTEFSFVF